MTERQSVLSKPLNSAVPSAATTASRSSVDDSVVRLNRVERWVLETVRRRGTVGFVVTMTLAIVLTSLLITVLGVNSALDQGTVDNSPQVLYFAVFFAVLIPALVAPPALYASVRLTGRLDQAGASLRLAALTDPLTGVWNRRGFFEAIERRRVTPEASHVAMIDVDEFKQLNDQYGHATGDLVLVRVAEWLADVVGDEGIVARMGGDEFAVMVAIGDVGDLPVRQSLVMDGVSFDITIGHSSLDVDDSIDDALSRADQDLYKGKSERN